MVSPTVPPTVSMASGGEHDAWMEDFPTHLRWSSIIRDCMSAKRAVDVSMCHEYVLDDFQKYAHAEVTYNDRSSNVVSTLAQLSLNCNASGIVRQSDNSSLV